MKNGIPSLDDRRLREILGHVVRMERARLFPGADERLFQLPCPVCLPVFQKPYSLILDLRTERYRCKYCKLDVPWKEVEDAGKEPL